MIYDEDQCIGTLFGLANRLVLRSKTLIEADLTPKLILIPHSDSIEQSGHEVFVKYGSSGPVEYYAYQVNRELGCLTGINGSPVESRLYLARLHALTSSGCIPDPLTGRTGIEEAISLIWLAGGQTTNGQYWSSRSQSAQIRFASAYRSDDTWRFPRQDHLRQEAYLFPPSEVTAAAGLRFPMFRSLDQLLLERPPPPKLRARAGQLLRHNGPGCNPRFFEFLNIDPLRRLFSSLRTDQTAPPFQSQYISRLHSSAYHFRSSDPIGITWNNRIKKLREHFVECKINYTESLNMVEMALGPTADFERTLEQCGQWPRVTPFILFRCLASASPTKLSESWKKCLVSLALLALDVQRARRLVGFASDNLEEDFYKELENEGCDERDLIKYPDWLLIQLQGNFLIRRIQADIAKAMMSPRSGKNSVMQVNMGEGKSFVIIPICAAALADGNRLVRIIVPKALIPQTLQVLSDRLCGLVNKPIYSLAFSRDKVNLMLRQCTSTEHQTQIVEVERLFKRVLRCRYERGIIIMQPEDILSLKLACLENQLLECHEIGTNSNSSVPKESIEHVLPALTDWVSRSVMKDTYVAALARQVKRWNREPVTDDLQQSREADRTVSRNFRVLMEIQKFFEIHSRDILDESDDVLRPQFQLIYATGHQHPFEGSPDRWIVIQKVLRLVKQHAHLLSTLGSNSIGCDGGSHGSFPRIHILKADGGEQLISLIADDVLDGRLPRLSIHHELGIREAIRKFILCEDVDTDTAKTVARYAGQSTGWGSLLLLRGLLAHNALLFAFTQRRWRVDYGLDLSSPPRTLLAIPYRAKDVPTRTAEFGHPDMTILLTCLSYYYAGLGEDQLRMSFDLLLQEDDPSSEYMNWLEDCQSSSVPIALQKLSGVNIRSLEQWNRYIVPLFARNKRAIDLYLSKVVFTKYAKEFALRISGSYWDLAEEKNHLVTGFSGTNDGQYLLPTSIAQDDPDHLNQKGSNAMVLAYLLQPENSSYMVTTDAHGERWSTRKLLEMIVAQNPKIRVLLDVGALILDLTNLQLAEAWLEYTPTTETAGAIYFSEDDELMVLERNGITRPLSSSSLVQRLHQCVAYLDNAHTRGTDIKFPLGFRAAVTLGHKVTKDHLVQGCMRMRRLGHGHSVMFFAPHEVDQSIRGLVGKESPNTTVTPTDILHWGIQETWNGIQRHAPYWAQQGMSHQSRHKAWSRFCEQRGTPTELAEAWVQPELKTLADMYMPRISADTTSSTKLPRKIREHCENLGVLSLRDVRMDEEQEREVSREIEREREVEIPPEAFPAKHFLHPDVIRFVRTGVLPSPSRSNAFIHVFTTVVDAASAWSPYILATADFCKTIEESEAIRGRLRHYLRPVQWVMSGKMHGRDALVLLSPFEVDQLMPEIRISERVHLHLYIPRTSKRMKPSDDLRLYTVPPLPSNWEPPSNLIDQLNMFAGQLYLSSNTSYIRVCRFLGVHSIDAPQQTGTVVLRNWLKNPDSDDTEIRNRFEGTPLSFVMYLLALRRGVDFAGTHLGRILDGWPLTAEDFPESITTGRLGRQPTESRVSAGEGGNYEPRRHPLFFQPSGGT